MMLLHFGKLSSLERLVLRGLTKNMHIAYATIMEEKEKERITPYSCQKIISSTPGVGDHHGCPYRHFSEENLTAALSRMGVNSRALGDVIESARLLDILIFLHYE